MKASKTFEILFQLKPSKFAVFRPSTSQRVLHYWRSSPTSSPFLPLATQNYFALNMTSLSLLSQLCMFFMLI